MEKPTLSVVIAAKNESKNIRECLETVKWADEIIVIDMFSEDDTIEIAKEFNARVYQSDGGPHKVMKYNLNYGFEKAEMDWILIIDADERMSEETKEEILEKIKRNDYDGYYFNMSQIFFGKFLTSNFWSKPKIIRLFKRGTGHYTCETEHETLKLEGKIGRIENPILHYGYPDIQTFVKKANLYTSNDAKIIFEHKKGGWLNKKIKKITLVHLIVEPILYFFFFFLFKKNYKDGMHGLLISILMAWYLFIERAKVWELEFKNRMD